MAYDPGGMPKTYTVQVIDNQMGADRGTWLVKDIPDLELAREFVRRRLRASTEGFREPGQKVQEAIDRWRIYGESAYVEDDPWRYDLREVFSHEWTDAERDWQGLARTLGLLVVPAE